MIGHFVTCAGFSYMSCGAQKKTKKTWTLQLLTQLAKRLVECQYIIPADVSLFTY